MNTPHSAAPDYIPFYLPGADGSDPIFTAVIVFLVITLVCLGALYFKLHSLPEHIGEKQNSFQLQLISVLVLLALFTHNNAFWVLALLIAVVKVPDFLTPIEKIAESLSTLAEQQKQNEPSPQPKPQSQPKKPAPPEQNSSEKPEPKSQTDIGGE